MKIVNISKRYISEGGNVQAVSNVSLDLPEQGLIAVCGKSGSGKTTLLQLVGGLLDADSGQIFHEDKNLCTFSEEKWDDYRNEKIGIIFQDFQLFEDQSVEENLLLPLLIQKRSDSNDAIDKVLEYVDMAGMRNKRVSELSGGQKQRIAIARAIITNPVILLADEPTGHLDEDNSEIIWKLLKRISNNALVFVVTHDTKRAEAYASQLVYMKDGRVVDKKIQAVHREQIKVSGENMDGVFSDNSLEALYKLLYDACEDGRKAFTVERQVKEELDNEEISVNNSFNTDDVRVQPCGIGLKKGIRFAWRNIKRRRIRHCITCIMLSCAFLLSFVSASLLSYDYYDLVEKYMADYDVEKVILGVPTTYTDQFFSAHDTTLYRGEVLQEILADNWETSEISGYRDNLVAKNGSFEKAGVRCIYTNEISLEINGRLPSQNNEIALTDYVANSLCLNNEIGSSIWLDDREFVVVGIVHTDYLEYGLTQKIVSGELSEYGEYLCKNYYNVVYASPNVKTEIVASVKEIWGNDFRWGTKISQYTTEQITYGNVNDYNVELIEGRDIRNSNEVLISESMMWYLGIDMTDFSESKLHYDFINLNADSFNRYYSDCIDLYKMFPDGIDIVGVCAETEDIPYVLMSDEIFERLIEDYSKYFFYDGYYIWNYDSSDKIVEVMRSKGLVWDEPASNELLDISKKIKEIDKYIIAVTIIVIIMAFAMLFNCITLSIRDSSGDIGIMRAIGVRKNSTFLIYIAEISGMLLTAFGIAAILNKLATIWVNSQGYQLLPERPYDVLLIHPLWVWGIVLVVLLIGILLMSIPLNKFSKIKPAELMRKTEE